MNPRSHPHRRADDDHPIRHVLDSWRFWQVVGFTILVGIFILAAVTFRRESNDRAKVAAVAAAREASAQAEYQQCLASRPFLMKFNLFVRGVNTAHHVLLLNALAMHAITPPGSVVYHVQEKNIIRLRRSVRDVKFPPVPVQTKAECKAALRKSLSAVPPATTPPTPPRTTTTSG